MDKGILTLNPLTWKIRWAPNNASRWQMGFNSALKGLKGNSNNTQFWVYALSCECNPHVTSYMGVTFTRQCINPKLQCVCRNTTRKSMEWTDMNRQYLSSPSCEICEQLQKTFVLVQPVPYTCCVWENYEIQSRISTGSHWKLPKTVYFAGP